MFEDHTCPRCSKLVKLNVSGRILRPFEWCTDCKDEHKHADWEVRWFNHKFQLFTKRDIFLRDGLRCYICKKALPLTSKASTIDHEVPLARGGLSTFSNLRLCCLKCNNKKADLLLEEALELFGDPESWV